MKKEKKDGRFNSNFVTGSFFHIIVQQENRPDDEKQQGNQFDQNVLSGNGIIRRRILFDQQYWKHGFKRVVLWMDIFRSGIKSGWNAAGSKKF